MEVIIDGIAYVPAQVTLADKTLESALDIRFDSDAGDNLSIRDYLYTLLETLWAEGEGFSSKRPFGNSGWEFDLYAPLIKYGFISGEIDEDGGTIDVDADEANQYVFDLIKACFYGVDKS